MGMPETVVVLPDCLRDIFAFEKILQMAEKTQEKQTVFDFSKIGFIEPYSMAGLLLLGRNHLRSTGEKIVADKIPLQIHQYLARMDFFAHGIYTEAKPLDRKKLLSRSSFSKRVIELTGIPNKERESVKAIGAAVTLFRKRASHILKHFMAENTADMLVTAISELCQNVFEHSLDSGFFTVQSYDTGSAHIVRLVISDSGIGIEGSFRDKEDRFPEKGAAIISRALRSTISSKRPFGYGLCQVNEIVTRLGGSLFIRSDAASVAVLNKGSKRGTFLKDGLASFPGTQVSITLSTD
jgi:anti-sigma regulatory factor (Ser/Thr protein kinase)